MFSHTTVLEGLNDVQNEVLADPLLRARFNTMYYDTNPLEFHNSEEMLSQKTNSQEETLKVDEKFLSL